MLDTNFAYSKAMFAWCQARRTRADLCLLGRGLWRRRRFPRGRGRACGRSTSMAGRSSSSTSGSRARTSTTPASSASATSTSTGRARRTRAGWRASSTTSTASSPRPATVRLFGASHGVGDGEHRRDFVFVGDVVAVNLWAFDMRAPSGVYNVGTGSSRTFNDLARAVIAAHGSGRIEYIPMPADLAGAYQAYTEADISRLRRDGYAGRSCRSRTGSGGRWRPPEGHSRAFGVSVGRSGRVGDAVEFRHRLVGQHRASAAARFSLQMRRRRCSGDQEDIGGPAQQPGEWRPASVSLQASPPRRTAPPTAAARSRRAGK